MRDDRELICCMNTVQQQVKQYGGRGFSGAPGGEFEAKITSSVIISCVMAATGGLMFGYDVGISGGVTSMPSFLKKFFHAVYERTIAEKTGQNSNYCKYDNQYLQLFTSSLYLAALVATMFAGSINRKVGRKLTMFMAASSSSWEQSSTLPPSTS
ncbi:sugar transport protein 13-like, partial [Prosopis cineraria]|uniref:sugar transport protein 13-like n=1 Tax=Prosopis cineraria TaxID=364024 RepID=UPI00240EF545